MTTDMQPKSYFCLQQRGQRRAQTQLAEAGRENEKKSLIMTGILSTETWTEKQGTDIYNIYK
jgi:hypothetical protein